MSAEIHRQPDDPRRQQALDAAGKLVHDFYNGVERIFERIAVRLGPGLPVGPGWHTLRLRSMESTAEGVRPAVIDHDLSAVFQPRIDANRRGWACPSIAWMGAYSG